MAAQEATNPQVKILKRNRKLQDDARVFEHNAWDDTEWTDEMYAEAERKLQAQRQSARYYGDANQIAQLEALVSPKWNDFYHAHEDKFFKDRKWIFSEFPELLTGLRADSGECNVLEVGCGVGNAIVHLLANNHNPRLNVFCCDLSQNAIDTLKLRNFYLENSAQVTPFQADICADFDAVVAPLIPAESLDFVMLIFTASALRPEAMQDTFKRLVGLLKPGGLLLFRDYARYDLTQLRFKGSALLRDNYYLRADGTTSYFFTPNEVDELLRSSGLMHKVELKQDNRLLVNRLKGIKMSRCWILAKYKKSSH